MQRPAPYACGYSSSIKEDMSAPSTIKSCYSSEGWTRSQLPFNSLPYLIAWNPAMSALGRRRTSSASVLSR
jgi:hypothetical protein